jgi:polar amino acid transport system substrate-binding protein
MPTAGPEAFNRFCDERLEVFAGLRPGLLKDIEKMPGATILPGKFSAVQQAVGTAKPNKAGATYLAEFVEQAKQSGLVASLIQKHNVKGLSVAPSR